jgi:hypothetical protein
VRYPKSPPTTDAKAIAGDVVQDVFSMCRAHGISIPLDVMAAVIDAVEKRYGEKKSGNHTNAAKEDVQ